MRETHCPQQELVTKTRGKSSTHSHFPNWNFLNSPPTLSHSTDQLLLLKLTAAVTETHSAHQSGRKGRSFLSPLPLAGYPQEKWTLDAERALLSSTSSSSNPTLHTVSHRFCFKFANEELLPPPPRVFRPTPLIRSVVTRLE